MATAIVRRDVLRDVRILVVDDEEDIRDVIVSILSWSGADATAAASAHEARQLLKTATFDLLLTDISMPIESGIDLVRSIRADGQRIRIAAITARVSERDQKEMRDAGFDSFLAKPFGSEQIVSFVVELARRYEEVRARLLTREGITRA
jgi:CheY-like chemotaxis protein